MFGLGLGDRAREHAAAPPAGELGPVAPYALTVTAKLVLGWALAQLG